MRSTIIFLILAIAFAGFNSLGIDPAVALEAYDGGQLDPKKMRHTEWDRYYYGTDDSYSQPDGRKLWSTEWYRLFLGNADYRNKLTWRDIFSPVVHNSNINVVQYFSSGEEVLQTATEGVPWSTDSLPYIGETGRNSWNISEKGKGNRQLAGNLFIGFGRGGWEFRKLKLSEIIEKYKILCIGQTLNGSACRSRVFTPTDAFKIGDDELKINPFFSHFKDEGLYSPILGSQRAKVGLAHIVSYDIPALSHAAGGTEITNPQLLVDKVDMNIKFKRNDNKWPRGNGFWYHSDFKDVAYLYTFKLYNDMVAKGNLE